MIGCGLCTTFGADQTTFSAAVSAVPIYTTVSDRRGRPVSDLNRDDFAVLDNDTLVPITLFQGGVQPITIAVLLDDSPSLGSSNSRALGAARAFINRLLPGDRVCLGTFNRLVHLDSRLTGDRGELLARLEASRPLMAGTALWDALDAGVTALENQSGRRVVLLLTDGEDNSSRVNLTALRLKVEHEGVLVYAIGIRGSEGRVSPRLAEIARATGGLYSELRPTDDLSSTFRRVADELHQQYLLGFMPASLDGSTHRLEVKVKRRGVVVRARQSYVAPPGQPHE